ncbi:hypothetical protein KIL84_021524 [Mauremys mutica]|uniref:Uncharacterized protein n=1 Tax=Mauremys mutica TaxID=74926 RepID=A0A9D4B009_9SAUR|nr:hypothetical protein KIL84_021524 [Mauremys mutica]
MRLWRCWESGPLTNPPWIPCSGGGFQGGLCIRLMKAEALASLRPEPGTEQLALQSSASTCQCRPTASSPGPWLGFTSPVTSSTPCWSNLGSHTALLAYLHPELQPSPDLPVWVGLPYQCTSSLK